jgi:hypothetical protein
MDDPREPKGDSSHYVRLPWPVVAAGIFGVLAIILAIGLYANQNLRPQVQIVATSTPVAVINTPTLAAAAVATPPSAPTPLLLVGPTPTPPVRVETASPTASSTVNPALAEQVGRAYENYWQVRAEALFRLDDSKLSEVMDGDHLRSVEDLISELRSEGRAIETNVQHSYTVVEATIDSAKVTDSYVSNSVYVDPTNHVALSEPAGDRVRELYELKRVGGSWKVMSLAKI